VHGAVTTILLYLCCVMSDLNNNKDEPLSCLYRLVWLCPQHACVWFATSARCPYALCSCMWCITLVWNRGSTSIICVISRDGITDWSQKLTPHCYQQVSCNLWNLYAYGSCTNILLKIKITIASLNKVYEWSLVGSNVNLMWLRKVSNLITCICLGWFVMSWYHNRIPYLNNIYTVTP
jgi:hypothetical protein